MSDAKEQAHKQAHKQDMVQELDEVMRSLKTILVPYTGSTLSARLKMWDVVIDVLFRYASACGIPKSDTIADESMLKQYATRAKQALEGIYDRTTKNKWAVFHGVPILVSYNPAQGIWYAEDGGGRVPSSLSVITYDTKEEAVEKRKDHLNDMIAGYRKRIVEIKAEIASCQEEYESLEKNYSGKEAQA